jgi:hypothetical protein
MTTLMLISAMIPIALGSPGARTAPTWRRSSSAARR